MQEAEGSVVQQASRRPADDASGRAFLFLQGPHGRFFPALGRALADRGARVARINLNGGDRASWRGGCDYHGTPARWPAYLAAFLARERIGDIVLYGDCRPYHAAAVALAREAGVRVHVFEEGYLRPDWITLERGGVNGRSALSTDAAWYLREAASLPPVADLPALPGCAPERRWAAFFYYAQVPLQRWRFPFGPSHRARNPIWEGLNYLAKFRRATSERDASARALAAVAGCRFMLFPLQLDADYQIRVHSPFAGMRAAARAVLASFAAHAPTDMALIVKEHPLDSGLIDWRGFFDAAERDFGLSGRLAFVERGDLEPMVDAAVGMVTVNSTAGTLALAAGKPVKVLGQAVYDIAGLTDQQSLDRFWAAPAVPDPALFAAYCRVLIDRCLIRGAFLSEAGADALVATAADRLLGPDR